MIYHDGCLSCDELMSSVLKNAKCPVVFGSSGSVPVKHSGEKRRQRNGRRKHTSRGRRAAPRLCRQCFHRIWDVDLGSSPTPQLGGKSVEICGNLWKSVEWVSYG